MATVSKSPSIRKPRRFAFRKRWLFLPLLLALLIWFAPAIVGHTPLRHWAVQQILTGLDGKVTFAEASLSWNSPVTILDLKIHDNQGNLVLETPKIESAKTLWELLSNSSDLGVVRCERPTMHVVFAGGKSNIEKVFATYISAAKGNKPKKNKQSAAANIAVDLQVTDGKIHVRDDDAKREWALESVDIGVRLPAHDSAPVQIHCDADLPGTKGKLEGKFTIDGSTSAKPGNALTKATVTATDLPLALIQPLVRRFDASAELQGRLQADIQAEWSHDENGMLNSSVKGNIAAAALQAGSKSLGPDRIFFERVALPLKVSTEGMRVHIHKADLICDAGGASIRGTVNLSNNLKDWLQQAGVTVAADVDLAKVAAVLPKLLRLREGTRITKGRAVLLVNSVAADGNVVWEGSVHSSDLQGVAGGKDISWAEPLSLHVRAKASPGSLPLLERLQCKSAFLTAKAAGDDKVWSLTADYDLDQLAEKISQFADLKGIRLSGKGATQVTLQKTEGGKFDLKGNSEFKNLEIIGLGARAIREDNLLVKVTATGKATQSGMTQIDLANAHFHSGKESVHLQIPEPMQFSTDRFSSRLVISVVGDIPRWQNRLSNFIPAFASMKTAGRWEMAVYTKIDNGRVECERSRVILFDPDIQAFGLHLKEPRAEFLTKGQLDLKSGKVTLKDAHFISPTVNVDSKNLVITPAPAGLQLAGAVSLKGDLSRLHDLLTPPGQPAPELINGTLYGNVTLQGPARQLGIAVNLQGKNVLLGSAKSPVWREAKLDVRGQGLLDIPGDRLRIPRLQVVGATLMCDVGGEVNNLGGRQSLDLKGTVHCDLQKMEPVFQPFLGKNVKMRGKSSRPIYVRGPLSPSDKSKSFVAFLQGETATNWTLLDAHGLQCGPAEMKLYLNEGWLVSHPIQTSLNNGTLRIRPALRLDPGPVELYLPKGQVIERAHITPQMCRGAIKYALPLLAGMTEGEGTMSLSLEGAHIPLDDTAKTDMAGTITIHDGRIAASPLISELAVLFKTRSQARLTRESVTRFRVTKGKVYHDKMELAFDRFTVRTSGWVGMDGGLQLAVQFPVPSKWLPSGRLGTALAKQNITIPVGGTLEQPRIDPRALGQAKDQFLRQATGNLLQNELNNGLRKLFGPGR